MNADVLRRAATRIRGDWDNPTDRRSFPRAAASWLAVADWLEMFAAVHEADHRIAFEDQAVTVARAYLGEAPL